LVLDFFFMAIKGLSVRISVFRKLYRFVDDCPASLEEI